MQQRRGSLVGRVAVRRWPTIMLAAPGCLLVVGLAVALGLVAFGRHPMWPHELGNLSEAAAVRDVAEIVRLIEYGENPNVARNIRAGLLREMAVRLRPLEAAVASQDPYIVRVLLANGAAVDALLWNRVRWALLHESELARGARAMCASCASPGKRRRPSCRRLRSTSSGYRPA